MLSGPFTREATAIRADDVILPLNSRTCIFFSFDSLDLGLGRCTWVTHLQAVSYHIALTVIDIPVRRCATGLGLHCRPHLRAHRP